MYVNKIRGDRYPALGEALRSPTSSSLPIKKISHSHAVTMLTHKESHIDMIKRRISALCIKDQKTNHRTVNNDLKWEQKHKIKEESLQIKELLEKQRKKDAERLEALKSRNLQSRVECYYRSKTFRKNQMQNKRQSTNLERTKSRQYDRIIQQKKQENIQEKRHKKEDVNKYEQEAKSERSRVILQRQRSVQQSQRRETEHLLNLGSIKDTQLTKLGELELLMVERNTSSRMAYEASIERLNKERKSSSNYYQPSDVIRSARQRTRRANHLLHD